MTSPSLELQGVIVSRLKADTAVRAVVADRVYDNVPKDAGFPRVTLGATDEISDDADCIEGLAISFQVDCWSQAVGFPQVRQISDAVRRSLHDADLALMNNALVSLTHRQTRVFRDPDGLTSHAAMTFDAFVEVTA
ncbi:MAG: DUF3168 domain-containing protein [Xanthobacteraceae bacterium]